MEEEMNGELCGVTAMVEDAGEMVRALECRVAEMEERMAAVERGQGEMAAAAQRAESGRRTVSATTQNLLAKHGVAEENAGGLAAVDAALRSLPVEQRLAVKSELLRAGLL